MAKCVKCKILDTNAPDGICVLCKTGLNESEGGTDVSIPLTKHKVCKRCHDDYEPTGNAQGYCPKCKELMKAEKKKNRKPISKKLPKLIPLPEQLSPKPSIVKNGNGDLRKVIECSQRLDKAIGELIETGNYDTKDLFFVRRSLGEVMIAGANGAH